MRAGYKSQIYQDLDRLFGKGNGPSRDRTLLDRFLTEGDESAFETLVARHGPMVLGVCRRLLVSPHDADDAFQSTFLVLVRKAGQIRDADHLGPWLYGVATRVATKARAQAARRRECQDARGVELSSRSEETNDWLDVRSILDAELGQLPAKNRDVLILCLLEGATAEEVSRQLDCPLGTVKSRLARGREALRMRLTSRGVAPAVALTAVSSVFASPVSAALTRTTLGTIAGMSAGVAPGISALTRGVAPAMLPRMNVMTCLLLGGIALAGLGTATWIKLPAMAQQPGVAIEPGSVGQAQGGETLAREQSKNNLKQLGLAFHKYVDANVHLPAAAIYGSDGQPKLSWRVALLPYLNENALYEEFHQEEPWDSPHNKSLIARMPAVFGTPHLPAGDGRTRLRGFMGKGALFDGVRGIGFGDILDGTSNTVLLASAREAIPWTKPGELNFATGQPLPALDESDANGWLVGMADGSAGDLPANAEPLLRKMITRAGGEVMPSLFAKPRATPTPLPNTPSKPQVVDTTGMPGMTVAVPSTPAAVEQRLQRLEEKLDRLIQRLDSQSAGPGKP